MIRHTSSFGISSATSLNVWSDTLSKLELASSRRRKSALSAVADYFSSLHADEVGVVAAFTAGELSGDVSLEKIGISPPIVREAICKVLGQSPESFDSLVSTTGGVGEYIESQLHPTSEIDASMTLSNLREQFLELASYRREPIELICNLLQSLSPITCRYLVRILFGIPPIGFSSDAILQALAQATRIELELIQQCFLLTSSIEDTADRAFRGRRALAQVHCRTGRPYHEMMYAAVPALDPSLAQLKAPVIVEEEFPGIRVQVHRRHASVELFTSRRRDVSPAFPEIVQALERSLVGTDDLILEGEIFLLSLSSDRVMTELLYRLTLVPTSRGSAFRPPSPASIALFDLTRQGREDLMPRPYEERRKRLKRSFRPHEYVVLSPATILESTEHARVLVEKARANGVTAIQFRSGADPYLPGPSGTWLRYLVQKEQYELAIVGGTLFSPHQFSRFTLACIVDGNLETVGDLTAHGSSAADWDDLSRRALLLVITKKADRVMLRPDIVLEVEARKIRRSRRRPSGYFLSGITLNRIRDDRSPQTVEILASLALAQNSRAPAREEDDEDEEG